MIAKNNVYRNDETSITLFVKEAKEDSLIITWCFKCLTKLKDWPRKLNSWEEVIEGPDGYIEYNVHKKKVDFIKELNAGYLLNEHRAKDDIILHWIPQHCFKGYV